MIWLVFLLTSCWTEMTLEERKEYTKQLEIRAQISKNNKDAVANDMWKYYIWCESICTPWWSADSRTLCITGCINSLRSTED